MNVSENQNSHHFEEGWENLESYPEEGLKLFATLPHPGGLYHVLTKKDLL